MEDKGRNFDVHFKQGKSDTWLTPKWVTEALGHFDTDPCTIKPAPWTHADLNYSKEEDGLVMPWLGRVWMNPPYSNPLIGQFTKKFTEHADGICFIYPRIDTRWFQAMAAKCDGILLYEGRIATCYPDGKPGGKFLGSIFVAFGQQNVEALHRLPGIVFGRLDPANGLTKMKGR